MADAVDVQVVAVCQMTSTDDKAANMKTVSWLVERAAKLGAKMVFLPEAFDYIAKDKQQGLAMVETRTGPTLSRCAELAKQHGVWLSLGAFHEKDSSNASKMLLTHVVLNTEGDIMASYNKSHLFDVEFGGNESLKESSHLTPGSSITPPVQTPVGKVGLAICYDVRFPELSLCLRQQGAEILTYPSAFMSRTGMAHWEVLLRARAIENQCYVIGAAQTGKHNDKRQSYGRAMIVDPWGSIIASCHEGVDVCIANVDLKYLQKVRQDMPVWNHRRYDLYGDVTKCMTEPTQ
ncbi:deaminated glutathione amidase-like isoform X2 [Amphiura filiformis]